jgi:hypothetical protein
MKLSENKKYLNAEILRVKGDISNALNAMLLCLKDAQKEPNIEPSTLSFLFQRLGELRYLNNEKNLAFVLFEKSTEVNNGSLITELFYAKFLANLCQDYKKAIYKCDFIISTGTSPSYFEPENTPSIDYFLENAMELKNECLEKLEHFE